MGYCTEWFAHPCRTNAYSKKGMIYVPRALMKRICTAIILLISVCHIIFLRRIAINYSAMLLILMLCTALFSICALYFNNNEERLKHSIDKSVRCYLRNYNVKPDFAFCWTGISFYKAD